VVAKVLAGRPKDIADVEGILRARGAELDLERVRRVLLLLEEALSQSDLLATFNAAAGAGGARGGARGPGGPGAR
jgi:hypothetical protein